MNKNPITSLHPSPVNKTSIGSRRRNEQAGRIFETPSGWHGEEGVLGCENVGCVGALCGAEDAVADFEARVLGGDWDGGDCAGEFDAADPREWWLVLVFALDLEDIEEVCARRVDFD
jgi:hypothetical protein